VQPAQAVLVPQVRELHHVRPAPPLPVQRWLVMEDDERRFWDSNPHPATHAAAVKFFKEKRDREVLKREIRREILEELRGGPESQM